MLEEQLEEQVTRREFIAGAAAIPTIAGGAVVWLEAVVAPSLPHRIAVPAAIVGKPDVLFELRTYTDPRVAATVWGRLSACGGLSTRLPDPRSLLIPFESFEHRNQAWSKLQADPEWQNTRDNADASYQFSIYRRQYRSAASITRDSASIPRSRLRERRPFVAVSRSGAA